MASNGSKKQKQRRKQDAAAAAEVEGDPQVWESFDKSFKQVQSVLDRNRLLIHEVNENHQSKIPDNMVKNVALIQELNGNISKVVSLYSDLSSNFSNAFHQPHHDNHNPMNGDHASQDRYE